MGLPIITTPAISRYRLSLGDLVLGETSKAVLVEEGGPPRCTFPVPISTWRC